MTELLKEVADMCENREDVVIEEKSDNELHLRFFIDTYYDSDLKSRMAEPIAARLYDEIIAFCKENDLIYTDGFDEDDEEYYIFVEE